MKTLKILLVVLLLNVIGFLHVSHATAQTTEANQRKINLLVEMTNELKSKGTQGFLVQCANKGWAAPKLFSAWYISRLPDDTEGLKQVEEAKSNLGLEFARHLTPLAEVVRETKDIPKLEQASDTLFAAAAWIGAEIGYGNLILQDRAYDIASVVAVKFMADLNYPMEKAEAAMKHFDEKWANVPNRRQVLFEESEGTHFKKNYSENEGEALFQEWGEGVSLAHAPSNLAKQPDLAIFIVGAFSQGASYAVPETTWQQKGHHRIGVGALVSLNLRSLGSLHEFRKRYGTFPIKPLKYTKGEDGSDIVAAFWELSWKDPLKVSGAARLYENYLDESLADKGWQSLHAHSKIGSQPAK